MFSTENLMMYFMQNKTQTGLVAIISSTLRGLQIFLTHGVWQRRRNYYNRTSLSFVLHEKHSLIFGKKHLRLYYPFGIMTFSVK
jgi:hypothetical protein